MRHALASSVLLLLGLPLARANSAQASAPAQQVVDRIIVRIEDDIITLSELRELGAFQQFVDGRSESDDRLRSELIEQWVINNEATTAHFPEPAASEVDREVAKIEANLPNEQAYRERIAALGLSSNDVRNMVTRQIYLARYLDYKFRPSVQVSDDDISKYYKSELVPELQAKGQAVPALNSTVSDQIRELLVQRGIDDRAASWLDQTKSRLKIEMPAASIPPAQGTPSSAAAGAR